jgi:adenylate kinase
MEDSQKLAAIRTWLGTGSINIFGRPFAGKDTHGRELAALFDGVLLGGGDILRNSVLPDHVKEPFHAGKLTPTKYYIKIVLPYLSREEFAGKPLILSSVGRWHGEEEGVLQATEDAGHPIKAALYLDISEDAVLERWNKKAHVGERGERHDDTKEAMMTRLEEYREKTLPVIDIYQKKGLLIDIDSTLEKKVVLDMIIDELYKRATQA